MTDYNYDKLEQQAKSGLNKTELEYFDLWEDILNNGYTSTNNLKKLAELRTKINADRRNEIEDRILKLYK